MNVFLLREVLAERYNTQYTELRNKLISLTKQVPLCSSNPHSSRPVGHSMQRSLKLKFQNAVNQVAFADGDTPALFVGGRRRNRKKRKNKNGQNKRKNKKEQEHEEAPSSSFTSLAPDFEYYDDYVPRKLKPTVSCLDIEEPVFLYEPSENKQKLILGSDYHSLYNSNESLDSSSKSRRDSGCEEGTKLSDDDDVDDVEKNTDTQHIGSTDQTIEKVGHPRTHSRDSGVYDDVDYDDTSVDDAGFYEDIVEDSVTSTVSDNDIGSSIKDELAEAEAVLASPTHVEGEIDSFEEINLTEEEGTIKSPTEEHNVSNEVRIITEIDHISDSEHFLNIADDDDDIIFDISQLELNTTQDDISNIGKEQFQLTNNEGSIFYPTDLEEHPLEQLSMDMLIEDDKDDEVLFEASSPRRELSITCNPLYEQSIMEEEERLSIKSYQDGFKTNFDSVNYIQIPGTASNKSKKESSPLLKSQDKDDELACCTIL